MEVEAKVEFSNGARLFIVNNFFDHILAEEICQCFQNVDENWKVIPEFEHYPGRLVYKGNITTLHRISQYGSKAAKWVSQQLGVAVRFKEFSLWLDQPGYHLPPHVDIGGVDYAVQIYLGTPTTINPRLGFSLYNNEQQQMFNLAYRHNAGYLLDQPQSVAHGMVEPINAPYQRWSVYMRFFDAF